MNSFLTYLAALAALTALATLALDRLRLRRLSVVHRRRRRCCARPRGIRLWLRPTQRQLPAAAHGVATTTTRVRHELAGAQRRVHLQRQCGGAAGAGGGVVQPLQGGKHVVSTFAWRRRRGSS